tara:strand:+ start:6385 stop:6693 length:309 start_codon:yes stop_codon:yes gene_type:complete
MIKFQFKEDGEYSFRLKSDKGHTLLKSVSFENKSALENIVSKLNIIVKDPTQYERKTNHNGEFLFILKDENGTIIGNSQCYNSEAGMENGIKNLKNTIDSIT